MQSDVLRSLLDKMERAAESTLQQDAAFFEALHALKSEIDRDPQVQAATRRIRAAGHSVFNSFIPHVMLRVRTESGTFALARSSEASAAPLSGRVASWTQELKAAASAVIMNSVHCAELNRIVQEAVSSNDSFERMAAQIEGSGGQLVIGLDLSAYSHVQARSVPVPVATPPSAAANVASPEDLHFSPEDREFLRTINISIDDRA